MESIRRLGDGRFLGDPNVPCRVYEWSVPNSKKFGSFKIKFVSPEEDGPRRFFAERVLRAWDKPKQNSVFLENACRCGNKILAALDQVASGQQESFPVLLAMFRNRNEGHESVTRSFSSLLDFSGGASSDSRPELVVPGFNSESAKWHGTHRATVYNLTKDWLKQFGGSPESVNANAVIETLQDHSVGDWADRMGDDLQPKLFRLDELVGRSQFDLFFTDGVWRFSDFDWDLAIERVRKALIYGPCTAADSRAAFDDPEFRFFASRISEKAKTRSVADFSKWLRNHRQQGFVKLLPSGQRLDGEKKVARERARRMFCALLWQSYQEMARCYGALMFE